MIQFLYTILACLAVSNARAMSLSNASATPDLGYKQLFDLQTGFYTKFLYPNNVKEARSINSTVFAENVQGRVSDTRNFDGRELNTEYIFGLFTPSDSLTIIGLPIGPFEILQFSGNKNVAAATTRVQFLFPAFGNITLPITVDTWLTWNAAREITQYDVVFRWFGNLLQKLLLSVNSDPVRAQAIAEDSIAKSICTTHDKYCHGANTQYNSTQDCYNFLTNDIRFGQSFELGMNTLLCRNVHEIMVKFRPDVHCSHIGKTGGGQCDDSASYVDKVEEKYFTNSPWIPYQVASNSSKQG